MEAMAQTPEPWPSLVDQLRQEGVELRDRGDTTNAIFNSRPTVTDRPFRFVALLGEEENKFQPRQGFCAAGTVQESGYLGSPSAMTFSHAVCFAVFLE